MFKRLAEAAWWLWSHRDTAKVLADLYEAFEAADDFDAKIAIGFEIAAVGARATDTEIDDKLVRALDSLRGTELGKVVIAYVKQMFAAEERMLRGAPPADGEVSVTSLEAELRANADLLEPSFASDQEEEAGSITLVIGIASLVFQVLRWYQNRRREADK